MALIDHLSDGFLRPELSDSALTKLWLKKGYAELAPSEKKEPWRNAKPVEALGGAAAAAIPPPTTARTRKPRDRVNALSRTQELQETARRLTQCRADANGSASDEARRA